VRRCTSVEDLFGRVGTYSVSDFLDRSHHFSTISISPYFKLFILVSNMMEAVPGECLQYQLHSLLPELEEEEDPFFFFLSFFPFDEETVSLILRLGVLGRSSGGRTIVGGEVQDMLLCLRGR
jgi:hypothetical protein